MPRQSRKLPERPDLRHLKDEAKARVKSGEFTKLTEAQLAIARELGLASWPKLKARVDSILNKPEAAAFFHAIYSDDAPTVGALLDRNRTLLNTWTDSSCWPDAFTGRVYRGDPNNLDGDGSPPLHYAAGRNAWRVARVLLEHGADVNQQGVTGNIGRSTPLNFAAFARADRIAVVRVLLEYGADPNVVSSEGSTALSTAIEHGEEEIVAALIDAGAEVTIADAVGLDRVEQVQETIAHDPTLLQYKDPYRGRSLLVGAKSERMRQMLWEAGVRPDVVEASSLGMTQCVAELLDANPAVINVPEGHDLPYPIHAAIRGGHLDTVKLLIARGADLKAEWVPGWTPLYVAEVDNPAKGKQTPQIAELLRDHGAVK